MEAALVLRWVAGALALGLLALPAAAALLAPLPSRGTGFAFAVGTAVVTLVTFWTGQVAFGVTNPVLGLLAVAGLSAVALHRGVDVPCRRFVESAGVFVAAFLLGAFLLASDPSLEVWAEGFLNFGLLKSLLGAALATGGSALPPEDFWFAARPVQYYYGGHLAAATWALLTDTPGRFAFNLAVCGFYATLVTAAYDLGGSLGAVRGVDRRLSGGLAAVFLGFAGNLFEPIRLAVTALPDEIGSAVVGALSLPAEDLGGTFSAGEATHVAGFPTDVPMYSAAIGSLHAHVLSQPYTLLVAGVLFAYWLTPVDRRRARVGRLAAVAPVLGLVGFTNVWSFPTGVGLVTLAVAFAPADPSGLLSGGLAWPPSRGTAAIGRANGGVRGEVGRWGDVRGELGRYVAGVLAGVLVGVLAVACVAPFVLATETTRPIAFLPERSGLLLYVVDYGALLAVFGLFLGPRLRRSTPVRPALLVGVALVAAAWVLDFAALAFVAPVLLAAWWLLRRADATGFETLLVLAGAGLALLVEVAYVRGGAAPGRYNTAFKVHSQVWLLWSVAAGAMLASIVSAGWRSIAGARSTPAERSAGDGSFRRPLERVPPDRDAVRAALAVGLLFAATTYGGLVVATAATTDRTAGEGPTLDATAFVADDHPDHARAIRWLDERPGRPRIVEAVPTERAMFDFRASPASSLTGLPTVAGWTHAADYHSEAAFDRRAEHVRTTYEGDAAARADLLRRYDVRYVYVGPYEREQYDVADLGAEPGLEPRRFGEVTVYVVNESALPS